MIWLIAFASLFLAYFAGDHLRRISNSVLRIAALIALTLLPLEAWIGWAWSDRCMLLIGDAKGERCAGYGMGVVMLFPLYGAWAFATILGYFCGKRTKVD